MEAVLQQAIAAYRAHGCRSNKKVSVIHEFIAKRIRERIRGGNVFSLPGKESRVQGHFHRKAVDVCVSSESGGILGVVSVKFIMSNHSQNAVNYIEQLAGEMVNLSGLALARWAVTIVFDEIAYMDKARVVQRFETFKSKEAYDKLIDLKHLDVHTLLTLSNGRGLFNGADVGSFTLVHPEAFEDGLNAFVGKLAEKLT